MTERLAADVARLPFAQVRFNYFVNWYPKSTTLAKGWSEVPQDWAMGTPPNPSDILDGLLRLLKPRNPIKEDTNSEGISDEQMVQFADKMRSAIADANHPYDKVGAVLAVFKDLRAELTRKSKIELFTDHATLRSIMTTLLDTFSFQALHDTQAAVLQRGFGETLSVAYQQELVQAYVDRDLTEAPPMDSLFNGGVVVLEKWEDEKEHYMLRSAALGQALRKVPPELLYLFSGQGLKRFTEMTEIPRRPDFWFVLKHYLATHDAANWSRPFVVDTLLRHGKAIYGEAGADQDRWYDQDDSPEPVYQTQMAPTMLDSEYAQHWHAAERAAWRDYRHLRLVLIEENPSAHVQKLTPAAKPDLVKLLRKSPATVFDSFFPEASIPLVPALLNAAVPGLGVHYQSVVDLDAGVQIGRKAMKALLTNSATDIRASVTKEAADLPADLFA